MAAGTGAAGPVFDEAARPVRVPLGALVLTGSPRARAEDPAHLRLLAGVEAALPPILVHRPTMRVIDGRHRVALARLNGAATIEARFFDGAEADAFVLAVTSNIAHGLPLCVADRKAAAARIIGTHPQWSDRIIAAVSGISARTVAGVRAGLGERGRRRTRIGRDGRVRPLDAGEKRRAAAALFAERPEPSLRSVARRAGISPETARDVRRRLAEGEDPVPASRRRPAPAAAAPPEPRPTVRHLHAEPELRNSADGRALLSLLRAHSEESENLPRIIEGVPPYCGGTVAELALECSRIWADFAHRLEREEPS